MNRQRHIGDKTERLALFLDVENLLGGESGTRAIGAGLEDVSKHVAAYRSRGTVVQAVACCHGTLARGVAFRLFDLGVRVFTHTGGADAADHQLIERITRDLPSVDTVVIGSGDHIFEGVTRRLRARGTRVEIVARRRSISNRLYRVADKCIVLPAIEQRGARAGQSPA